MFKGVTFGYYAGNGYFSSKQAKIEVDRIGELGIPWICLVSTIMQEAYYSTRMFRDFRNTPGDDELIEIIDYIHSKGIKVMLRPMIECWDGTQRSHVTLPQGEIQPGLAFHYRVGAALFGVHRRYAHCAFHLLVLVGPVLCGVGNLLQLQ